MCGTSFRKAVPFLEGKTLVSEMLSPSPATTLHAKLASHFPDAASPVGVGASGVSDEHTALLAAPLSASTPVGYLSGWTR